MNKAERFSIQHMARWRTLCLRFMQYSQHLDDDYLAELGFEAFDLLNEETPALIDIVGINDTWPRACSECGVEKDPNDYNQSTNGTYSLACKECRNALNSRSRELKFIKSVEDAATA